MSTNSPFFHILCVEDNPSLQSAIRTGLSRYGFDVVTAGHGIDALGQYKAQSGEFGAIVTDHDMPHMNGLELVQTVREMGFKGRIVVMSGRLKPEDLQAYQDYTISGFFAKPFEVSMLATLLLQSY